LLGFNLKLDLYGGIWVVNELLLLNAGVFAGFDSAEYHKFGNHKVPDQQ
jgi:hypothetical protein